jgi:hypothetical protein
MAGVYLTEVERFSLEISTRTPELPELPELRDKRHPKSGRGVEASIVQALIGRVDPDFRLACGPQTSKKASRDMQACFNAKI